LRRLTPHCRQPVGVGHSGSNKELSAPAGTSVRETIGHFRISLEHESLFLPVIQWFYDYGHVGFWSAFLLAIAIAALLTWILSAAVRRRTKFHLPVFALVLAIIAIAVFFPLHRYRHRFAERNLSSIRLLPDYTIQHRWGDDTYVGSISRPNGLDIRIDIGTLAGFWADPTNTDKHIWVFRQIVRGHTVFIGLRPFGETKSEKLLCVTFPDGVVNFFAVVRSDLEIAEMLSMVLTYEPMSYP
jgi:hypothetical protein